MDRMESGTSSGPRFRTTVFAYRSTRQGRRLMPVAELRHDAEDAACAAARQALLCGGVGAVVADAARPKTGPLHRFGQLPGPLVRPPAARRRLAA